MRAVDLFQIYGGITKNKTWPKLLISLSKFIYLHLK